MAKSSSSSASTAAHRKSTPLSGSYRRPPRGNRLGSVGPRKVITVTLEIRRQQELPSFGFAPELRPLSTRDERIAFGHKYGAGAADIREVEKFARAQKFTVVEKSPDKRRVRLRGTVAQMQAAFGVKLSRFTPTGGGVEFRGRQGAISLPAQLRKIVVGVHGLDNRPFARTHPQLGRRVPIGHPPHVFGDAADPFSRGFTGQDLAALYNFPAGTTGKGQTIAIIQLGGSIDDAEIARYFEQIGLQRDPKNLLVVNRPRRPMGEQPTYDLEVALDVQVAGAAAPGAKLVVYFAEDHSLESVHSVVLDAIHDTVHCPNILSISWGGPESETSGQFRAAAHETLRVARRFGITVIAPAGDHGSADHRFNDPGWDGNAHVDHPASDPLVLACGGTEIQRDPDRPNLFTENVWNQDRNNSTGGGVSRMYPLPWYQQDANVPKARNPRGPAGRGVPDVAANASGESGYLVLCDGQWHPDYTQGVGKAYGTSAVVPLWAGLVARLNEALAADALAAGRPAHPLGFLQPRLYALPPDCGAFTAITSGTNGDYEAGPGWNPCTGLGVPDGTRLLDALRTYLPRASEFVRAAESGGHAEPAPAFDVSHARRGREVGHPESYESRVSGDRGGSNVEGFEARVLGDRGGSNIAGAESQRTGDRGGSNVEGFQPRVAGDRGGSNLEGYQPRVTGDRGGSNIADADSPRTGDRGGSKLEGFQPRVAGDRGGSNIADADSPRTGDRGGSNLEGYQPRVTGDRGGSNIEGADSQLTGDRGGSNLEGYQPRVTGDRGGSNIAGYEPRGATDPGEVSFAGRKKRRAKRDSRSTDPAGYEPRAAGDRGGSNIEGYEPRVAGDRGGSNLAEPEPGAGEAGGTT